MDPAVGRTLTTVRGLCGVLAGGVVVFGAVVAYLVGSGAVTPSAPELTSTLLPVAMGFTLLSLLLAPALERQLRRVPSGGLDRDGLEYRFQSSTVVGFAVREGAALLALVMALLTGQLAWGLGLAGLCLVGMVLALPGEDTLRAYMRGAQATPD